MSGSLIVFVNTARSTVAVSAATGVRASLSTFCAASIGSAGDKRGRKTVAELARIRDTVTVERIRVPAFASNLVDETQSFNRHQPGMSTFNWFLGFGTLVSPLRCCYNLDAFNELGGILLGAEATIGSLEITGCTHCHKSLAIKSVL